MAITNIDFADELKKYGATEFDACYNCGNCTAICELTEKNANFPRMFIRYGMLGQKEAILQSKELWLCYACGECTEKCPRQAEPGNYMAAVRRYAIANYEPTGLTKLIFKSNPLFIIITFFLAVILGFFLFTIKPETEVSRWIFNYLPYEVIHNMGLAIFSLTGLSMVWGLVAMYLKLIKQVDKKDRGILPLLKAIPSLLNELATMKRYKNCDEEEDSYWYKKPAAVKPWFVHWSIMWGFIGLLLATILDFVLKDPATSMWIPSRILGTISGILMVYGTSMAMFYRIKKVTFAYTKTKLADWMLLIFLWIAGITGFWLEAMVAINIPNLLNQVVFIVHTIVSMELVLLFAFSKFAHAIYRPLALLIYNSLPKSK